MNDNQAIQNQVAPVNLLLEMICGTALASQNPPPRIADDYLKPSPTRVGLRQPISNSTDAKITATSNVIQFLKESPELKSLVELVASDLIAGKNLIAGKLGLVEDPDSDSVSVRLDVSGPLTQDELDVTYLKIAKSVEWEIRYRLSVIAE